MRTATPKLFFDEVNYVEDTRIWTGKANMTNGGTTTFLGFVSIDYTLKFAEDFKSLESGSRLYTMNPIEFRLFKPSSWFTFGDIPMYTNDMTQDIVPIELCYQTTI
jgi:hypothetical protein